MELLPKDAFDDGIRFPSLAEDLVLSESAIRARRALKRENKAAKQTRFRREDVLTAFAAAFQELGGLPRLVEWGDQNYGEYMKLFGKTLTPAVNQLAVNASGPVQIVMPPGLGPSALDESPDLTPDGLPQLPLKDSST
jgi:hypothetical protein